MCMLFIFKISFSLLTHEKDLEITEQNVNHLKPINICTVYCVKVKIVMDISLTF